MVCDYIALAAAGVKGLTPYQPGKPIEELERELGITGIIKLASNENPMGPSPQACRAVTDMMSELTRYPDGNGFTIKQALSKKLGVDSAQITLGNGSNDVLDLIARAYLTPESEAVFSKYAFAVYSISTQAVGAKAVVAAARGWGHDLDAMAAKISDRTRVVFIANPNNPTGTWLTRGELDTFLGKVPENVIVVLDEAYFEYMNEADYPDGIALLERYPNLVVTRTFSKAYGLASLRIGYGVSNFEVANILNRVRQPFNVNSLALAAATAALSDQEYLARSREMNLQGRALLERGLEQMGLEFIPSAGNFVTAHFDGGAGKSASVIYEALLRQGVIVRPVANYDMPNSLRISVGTELENNRFLEALDGVL